MNEESGKGSVTGTLEEQLLVMLLEKWNAIKDRYDPEIAELASSIREQGIGNPEKEKIERVAHSIVDLICEELDQQAGEETSLDTDAVYRGIYDAVLQSYREAIGPTQWLEGLKHYTFKQKEDYGQWDVHISAENARFVLGHHYENSLKIDGYVQNANRRGERVTLTGMQQGIIYMNRDVKASNLNIHAKHSHISGSTSFSGSIHMDGGYVDLNVEYPDSILVTGNPDKVVSNRPKYKSGERIQIDRSNPQEGKVLNVYLIGDARARLMMPQ